MLGGKLGFLADQLADPEVAWSLGAFGVIAEFTRDADEATTLDRDDGMISAVTTLGGIRIETHSRLRPIARSPPPLRAGAIAWRSAYPKKLAP
jgi:hypothetical protein